MRRSFIKTPREIESIKKACKISDSAFSFILKKIRVGITEKELAEKLTDYLKKQSDGISFKTIVAFGKNSSEIHHKVTNRKLKHKDTILFDFGAKINGYCSDLSRTVFFGKISNEQKKAYLTVLKAQEKSIRFLKSSCINNKYIRCFEVDKIARDYILKHGFPNMPHGLGHSLGKKVHMSPRLNPKSKHYLKPGMIFTIEPGIYLQNFGVRIEDVFLITKAGAEILTKSQKISRLNYS